MTKIIVPRTEWTIQCFREDGSLRWEEQFCNLVTDQGINDLLQQYFKGAGYTAAWYVGLINGPATLAGTDTMASHAGWTENTNYSAATRPALVLGPIGNKTMNNNTNQATYTMGGAATIGGVFLSTVSAKGGTSGILYAEALFAAGDQAYVLNDIIKASCTVTGV